MNSLFLAPHSDDEALFGSYIILRARPSVIVVTDGVQHFKKFGVPPDERRKESVEAMNALNTSVQFLGLSDEFLDQKQLTDKLKSLVVDGVIFVPKHQGGHPHHDMISDVATELWGLRVLYYSTYSKNNLILIGEMPLYPSREEEELKNNALKCYKSQLYINKPHFDAVRGCPEYLNFSH